MSSPTLPTTDEPLPRIVRMTAQHVLNAFGYALDKWTYFGRGQHHVLHFGVPHTETISLKHFVAAREASRLARVTVTWGKNTLNFVVRVPKTRAASKKRPATSDIGVHGDLHKKQRGDDRKKP